MPVQPIYTKYLSLDPTSITLLGDHLLLWPPREPVQIGKNARQSLGSALILAFARYKPLFFPSILERAVVHRTFLTEVINSSIQGRHDGLQLGRDFMFRVLWITPSFSRAVHRDIVAREARWTATTRPHSCLPILGIGHRTFLIASIIWSPEEEGASSIASASSRLAQTCK